MPRHCWPWDGIGQPGRLDNSEHDDDDTVETADDVTLVPTAGKQVVDAPEWVVRSQLPYDNGAFFARLDADHTDERCYN